jgi:hypothetical protein
MLHCLPNLLVRLAVGASAIAAPDNPQPVFFDTTLAVMSERKLSLDLRTAGVILVTGGLSTLLRIRVSDHGRPCGDCRVEVTRSNGAIELIANRAAPGVQPGDLQLQIELPAHFDIAVASAGGDVQIEGVDGNVSGQTRYGALRFTRLSGSVSFETARGDVTLKQSYVNGSVRTLEGRVLMEDVNGTVEGETRKGKVIKRRVERPSQS